MPVKPLARGQVWLLPPSLDEMIPSDHVVRFIAQLVDSLPLRQMGLCNKAAPRGEMEYDVRALLVAWIYGFMMRVRSTRRLEIAARENLALMWLLGGQCPDHSTLARFFQANRKPMRALFKQTVHTAVKVGLVGFALQAIDGTRVSTVSRNRTLTREELQELDKRAEEAIARLERSVADEEEAGVAEKEALAMPPELKNPEQLRERIQTALAEIDEREAKRRGRRAKRVDPKTGQERGPEVNLADPEAVIMKGPHGYVAGYNAQAAVDAKTHIIVGATVVAQADDHDALVPMVEEIEENTGRLAEVTTCDAGYHSADNLGAVAGKGTDLYVADPNLRRGESKPENRAFHKDTFPYDPVTDTYRCPAGQVLFFEREVTNPKDIHYGMRTYHCKACRGCVHFGQCTTSKEGRTIHIGRFDELLRQNREKMYTDDGKQKMKQRGSTVEPVFGIIREQQGMTRFLRRGVDNVTAEWHLLCATYNLRAIWRHWWCSEQRRAAAAA
jgi:transposase